MIKTVFLFSGEGTQHGESRYKLLAQTPVWKKTLGILRSDFGLSLEELWKKEIGRHFGPSSPVLTLVTQICLAEIWSSWGFKPDVVIGHSTGELAAAYQAGIYSLEQVLKLSFQVGTAAARLEGTMVHGWLMEPEIKKISANISALNFTEQDLRHLTISDYKENVDDFLTTHPDFIKMKLPHPWHHPDYVEYRDLIDLIPSQKVEEGLFISSLTNGFETCLADDHWRKWLINPIDFIQSVRSIKERYGSYHLDCIEIGFHPVLSKSCEIFDEYTYVSSMFRGEDEIPHILLQRDKLNRSTVSDGITASVRTVKSGVIFDVPLVRQGFTSMEFIRLATALNKWFPSLTPQDFYRYKTITQLIHEFGKTDREFKLASREYKRNKVVIAGMSCRLPASVETLPQFWEMLMNGADQIEQAKGRGDTPAGFLTEAATRFDHQYFEISQAESRTMDPQQILALELTEMLFIDAGIDPASLDKQRVGVYIGAWNSEYRGDLTSVYYPTGTNASIIASRISYHYDFRGPSWVSNTACSSSLLAVHYAAKDIEAGRIDYAVSGGVNMLLDEAFTARMQDSGFLSPDFKCKTFDDSANGYVRAEGGGLVLMANENVVDKYYARVMGSAVNQNGGRTQVITAPHPEAQEEVINAACREADIMPQTIAYLECHGTGTKIGDPIEVTAIQNTAARERGDTLYIGSVKSNLGHLESAAGIAGLIKTVVALNKGTIPPNLHFIRPNQFIDFKSSRIQVVDRVTPVAKDAVCGISSFGFGGANAHAILKGATDEVRKEINEVEIPFNRERAAVLESYVSLIESKKPQTDPANETVQPTKDISSRVKALLHKVTGIEEFDPEVALLDQGLDSMSTTELFSRIANDLKIQIDPDILFDNPLPTQFIAEIERLCAVRQDSGNEAGDFSREKIDILVTDLFYQLTGIRDIDSNVELIDQGLDSMSGTELVSRIEKTLSVDLGPDFLFDNPLKEQLIDQLHVLLNQR